MAHDDTPDRVAMAYRLFTMLQTGRASQHQAAQSLLPGVDHAHLRRLIIDALTGESPARVEDGVPTVRCSMLRILGRIAADDVQAIELLRHHLENDEIHKWVRYWTLEGLIAGRFAGLDGVAKDLRNTEREALVKMLAVAVLAQAGDGEALAEIEAQIAGLTAGGHRTYEGWATLMALRLVHLPSTVQALCEILAVSRESETLFDVIGALWPVADARKAPTELVASSLALLLKKVRGEWWMHLVRTKALELLGLLQVAETESTLIKELRDDDPGIVRVAAHALERLLGPARATARVVEAAGKAPDELRMYVEGLRGMSETEAIVEKLAEIMAEGDSEQQDVARRFLSEIGGTAAFQKLRAQTRASREYLKLLESAEQRLRKMFERSIREARSGFKIAMAMDLAVFVFGLVMLAVSAWLAFHSDRAEHWIGVGMTGGTGMAGALYGTFLARPRRQVQEAVNHLMHLNLVFLGYLRQLHQTDQAYTRRLLDDTPLLVGEVREFTEMVEATMAGAVERLRPSRRRSPEVPAGTVAHA
jgi:HEAT repeat protein